MDEPSGSPNDRHEGEALRDPPEGTPRQRSWAEWLDGMSLTHASDGTTVLAGPVADQAALHGLLQKLRDLGVTLISVNERETGCRRDRRPGQPTRPDEPFSHRSMNGGHDEDHRPWTDSFHRHRGHRGRTLVRGHPADPPAGRPGIGHDACMVSSSIS